MVPRIVLSLMIVPALMHGGETALEVKLWPHGAPGSEGMTGKEVFEPATKERNYSRLLNVHNPSVYVYLPPREKATGAAMVIAPGGGHEFLAIDHEGHDIARWLNSIGVAGFVLKYRLAKTPDANYKVEVHSLQDAQRAIRLIRTRSTEWGINPDKVGIVGFSAGGAVTLLAATRFDAGNDSSTDPIDRQKSRPDFAVLVYPGFRPDTVEVPKDMPPTFMISAYDDKGPATALGGLYASMRKAGVPAELHVYNRGGHGFGMRPRDLPVASWNARLRDWLADLKMLQGPSEASGNVASPEVNPDRTVTFRVSAPKAQEVSFSGDWMPPSAKQAMTKDAAGVWSVTLGPLPPSIYIYTFTVDGITMADPVNPRIKLRSRTSASMVEVPPETPALWQARDVPHGAVEINWQKSKVLNGETRWVWVYTPPGYEKERDKRYPVLYLFHGSNDIAGGWTLAGNANFILDNLLAEKKATPMIIVMPYGHAVPFGSPREVQAKNASLFEEYVLKDVMPLVESKYRVAPGREKRAVAGLSMGGGQSLLIGFDHLELFSAVGAFSAAVPGDFETRFAQSLNDAQSTNGKLKTLWVGCGKQDSLFERAQKLSDLLDAHQIKHTFRATEGMHTYTVWRQYLGEFVPLLFR